jgi:glycosyltransferase involved in cell wall biosynthesis
MFEIASHKYIWFFQSAESRFYSPDKFPWATEARLAQELDIPVITISSWLCEVSNTSRRESPTFLALNGVDKSVFGPKTEVNMTSHNDPLRIVIEGSEAWFKGINNSISGLSDIDFHANVDWFSVTSTFDKRLEELLRKNTKINLTKHEGASQAEFFEALSFSDILIKSSYVEGLPGPPLEAFHAGCTGIFTHVTGIEEYVDHLSNAILVPFDDPGAITNWLRILNKDRGLLFFLKESALETAKSWPDLKTSEIRFIDALESVHYSEDFYFSKAKRERYQDKVQEIQLKREALRVSEVGNVLNFVPGRKLSFEAENYLLGGASYEKS